MTTETTAPAVQPLPPEQRAQVAELIGNARPTTNHLLLEMAQQIRDRREHDHSTAADWDWYCLNASGWLGDKAPTVLRRLLDAEARVAELEHYRSAFEAQQARAETLDRLLRTAQDRVAELEAEREKLVRWHGEDSKTINRLVARIERHRARLVALQNDALSMRGSLAPADGDRKVPFELGETLTPAVDWLIARIAELEDERHKTNESLDDAVQALRAREKSPLTVYRASHDSIPMGLYTTAAEARKHCETEVQREHAETTEVSLWWREDEDTVDQPEDGEQELWETVRSKVVPGPGLTRSTGYVVTPLEVAAAYDEEAAE